MSVYVLDIGMPSSGVPAEQVGLGIWIWGFHHQGIRAEQFGLRIGNRDAIIRGYQLNRLV